MTILLNTIFILFIGIWFIRFFVEMDVPEKYRVSRFFQNTTDYKGEGLTKKDVLRILFLAFLIRVLIYFASVLIYLVQSDFLSHAAAFSWNDFFNLWNKSDAQHYLDLAEKGYVNCTEVTEWSGRASISRLLPVISLVHPLLSLFCEQLCCGCICCFHHFFLCGLCLFLWCCKGGIRSFHCREIIDFVIVIPVFFFLRRNHDRELVFLSDFCGFFLYPQA